MSQFLVHCEYLVNRCAKELNQWEMLLEVGASKINPNPLLVLESAWRVPKMPLMKDALTQVEHCCPKEYTWKVGRATLIACGFVLWSCK